MAEEKDKAYKLLAKQENVSNTKAKELIDKGLVYVGGKKLTIARGELPHYTVFKVHTIDKIETIFEDDDIIAINKPPFINCDEIVKKYPKNVKLLHRLDKDTSGVMLLVKNEDFRRKAINEFKKEKVYKEYEAIVYGRIVEEFEINYPIETTKMKGKSISKVSLSSEAKPAFSLVEPVMLEGKKTKVKVVIKTGRTHQIRVHLSHMGYPIVGDTQYNSMKEHKTKRIMLHAKKIKIFNYEFEVDTPKDFKAFGF
jgi:23S rRNA pseudouridine1911/1915/1917 synthase